MFSLDPDENSIILYFICVFTVCQSTHLGVSSIQRVKGLIKYSVCSYKSMCAYEVRYSKHLELLYSENNISSSGNVCEMPLDTGLDEGTVWMAVRLRHSVETY